MADQKTNLRIVHSRRVLAGWETMGRPVGQIEDLLRMIGQEVDALLEIAEDHPEKTATVDGLVERYRVLRDSLKAMTN
jgi:hypothetical protein